MKEILPQRKSIRLKEYDYTHEAYYFITICIKNRINILGKIIKYCRGEHCSSGKMELSYEGKTVKKYLELIHEKYNNIIIDEYVIMPNHIHMILTITEQKSISVSKVIQQYKGIVTKELGYSIWQKLFYEHIIRNEKEYYLIKEYIQNNVINWEKDKYF